MLTLEEYDDVELAKLAVLALWISSLSLPEGQHPITRLTSRCIYATLALIDVLANVGIEGHPLVCGLEVYRQEAPKIHAERRLMIGYPRRLEDPMGLNAHVVARVGDLLVDATLAQARRPWNDLKPYVIAPLLSDIERACTRVRVKRINQAAIAQVVTNGGTRVSYFELPKTVARRASNWREAGDARAGRRQDLVGLATRLMRKSISSRAIADSFLKIDGSIVTRDFLEDQMLHHVRREVMSDSTAHAV